MSRIRILGTGINHHKRHGLAAFLLGITALALAWEMRQDRDSPTS
jgi:hypothetical protein